MTHLIAIDPGRSKCGLVLVDRDQACVVEGIVLPRQEVDVQIETWIATVHGVERILLGDGTSSEDLRRGLKRFASVEVVQEKGTTLRARQRYWQLWPPRGWRRLIPKGMQIPPGNLDAVAALVILEDELGFTCLWEGSPPTFRNEREP